MLCFNLVPRDKAHKTTDWHDLDPEGSSLITVIVLVIAIDDFHGKMAYWEIRKNNKVRKGGAHKKKINTKKKRKLSRFNCTTFWSI